MEALEESFTGKKVIIECFSYNCHPILYEGTYDGIRQLGERNAHVLKNASYLKSHLDHQGAYVDRKFEGCTKIFADLLAIPADNVLHICIERTA